MLIKVNEILLSIALAGITRLRGSLAQVHLDTDSRVDLLDATKAGGKSHQKPL